MNTIQKVEMANLLNNGLTNMIFAEMHNKFAIASKIIEARKGTWHTVAYKSQIKNVPGLVRYVKVRLQIGDYENFKEVQRLRQNGVQKRECESFDVHYENGIVYNVKSKKYCFKFRRGETLEETFVRNGFVINSEIAKKLIGQAYFGEGHTLKDFEFRRVNLENIFSFR